MKFTPEVEKLFEIFGGDIRLVGGCVRDLLLKKKVNDFDFATKFLPEEITEILTKNKIKAVPTGARFGTITAVINHQNFEITTLRKDNETDGRHCAPEFVDDYALDAARRDFTINALYLDSCGKFYDYFDGISDLKKHRVRFIGAAQKRIEEDFLRILRFFRFSAEYAQEIDVEGLKACVRQKKNLKKISRERIRQEFLKLLASKKKERALAVLRVMKRQKITDEIFSSKLDIPALASLRSDDPKLKLAALLLSKNFKPEEICATNAEKKFFSFLLKTKPSLTTTYLREVAAFYGEELMRDFCHFTVAKKNLLLPKKLPKDLPKFPLVGEDVMRLGFSGKKIGEALDLAKRIWAKKNFKPNKKDLLRIVIARRM